MPGLEFDQVSSNWKKLQGQLQARNPKSTPEPGVKRKRPVERNEKPHGIKKLKASASFTRKNIKISMMASKTLSQSPSNAQQVHVNGSVAASTTADSASEDQINAGLHPTNRAGKYVAIDCEMVGTGPPPHRDHVLARVSLVNYHGQQLYDSYVLPQPGVEVKDYRTFVSGIQPYHLMEPGYARPFGKVRAEVTELLKGRILVGHAVGNDLLVLRLQHPQSDVRDTSRYSKFRKGSHGPPALRHLAKTVLGLEIQNGEHSSLEDARATMALFRRESAGFEEQAQKKYGATARGVNVKAVVKDDDLNGDEDEDADALEGEKNFDLDVEGEGGEMTVQPMAKKKHKKKKRTKRK